MSSHMDILRWDKIWDEHIELATFSAETLSGCHMCCVMDSIKPLCKVELVCNE